MIAANLDQIRARMRAALAAAGRPAGAATLIAVAKTFPAESVAEALAAGTRVFGENRVQEAMGKYSALRAAHPDLDLHLIGPLQTNKVKEAVATFDAIHTLDRPKLAAALAAEIARTGKRPKLFVQVNTGSEPQKAGVLPEQADAFIAECREVHRLTIDGLMCIPPLADVPAPHFAFLGEIAKRNGIACLSMGMSGDYETALALGATHIRVGSAIFGTR